MPDKPLILVVDDEPAFREIFQTQLAAAGYRIDTAQNGEEAIEKAKAIKPNLILMDVKMPVMEGTEAALKIRQDASLDATKIVFLTSLGDPQAELQGIDAKFARDVGFQGYIKKTEDLAVLVSKVRQFVMGE